MRCPSCGEYDVITCHHCGEEDECTERCHSVCANCDYGICEEE